MDKDKEIEKLEYINTPFAYTRQQQGLTLLQQNIMNRVSAHLQRYFNDYWNNKELRESKEVPRTFMTDEQIESLGPIRVELSELGISASTYERVRDARKDILNITLNGVVPIDTGAVDRAWNIISYIDLPLTDHGTKVMKKERVVDEDGKVHKVGEAKETQTNRYRGYMEIHLNKSLLKAMLDVTQGYVSHPENIAQIGNVPNMPLMYYFIRHAMNNFKPLNGKSVNEVKVDLCDLREYLGMTKKNAKGEVVEERYATYSQFKSKVLKTALDDIKRIYNEGYVDFYFEMKEIRPRGKKIGTPSYLVFIKKDVKEEQKPEPTLFDTAEEVSKQEELLTSLMNIYPSLDSNKLKSLFASVGESNWKDFNIYVTKEIPKAVERPHRWDGTMEDFVYYIIAKHIEEYKKSVNEVNVPEPKPERPVKPQIIRGNKQMEWGMALSRYSGPIKSLISEIPYLGTLNGFPLLNPSKEQREQLEANGEEWNKFLNIVREICGFSKHAPVVKFKSQETRKK